jgi:hypothetical protein
LFCVRGRIGGGFSFAQTPRDSLMRRGASESMSSQDRTARRGAVAIMRDGGAPCQARGVAIGAARMPRMELGERPPVTPWHLPVLILLFDRPFFYFGSAVNTLLTIAKGKNCQYFKEKFIFRLNEYADTLPPQREGRQHWRRQISMMNGVVARGIRTIHLTHWNY